MTKEGPIYINQLLSDARKAGRTRRTVDLSPDRPASARRSRKTRIEKF